MYNQTFVHTSVKQTSVVRDQYFLIQMFVLMTRIKQSSAFNTHLSLFLDWLYNACLTVSRSVAGRVKPKTQGRIHCEKIP